MMVAAAPIGAMGLVFASIYNVTTDAVVRSGIVSYVLALLSIPIVGGITHWELKFIETKTNIAYKLILIF